MPWASRLVNLSYCTTIQTHLRAQLSFYLDWSLLVCAADPPWTLLFAPAAVPGAAVEVAEVAVALLDTVMHWRPESVPRFSPQGPTPEEGEGVEATAGWGGLLPQKLNPCWAVGGLAPWSSLRFGLKQEGTLLHSTPWHGALILAFQ